MQERAEPGRVAAVDFGQARIGVAVSDELRFMAHPRPFVPSRPPQRALRLLKKLFLEEGVELVLVGLALTLDGREGLAARKCRKFSEELAQVVRLPIELVDERLSTVEAQARLHEAGGDTKGTRSRIDSASAAILLQSWLDGSRMRENS